VTAAIRYRRSDLLLDYGRAALGAGFSGAMLAAPTAPAVTVVAGGLAALFGVFALRTAARQATRYELSASGISEVGWRKVSLRWDELDGLKLRYYAPRRKKANGWMALSLRAAGRRLSIDSTLPGFKEVAAMATAAARRNALDLDDITIGNLSAMELPNLPAAPAS
jgi:hypothetical protein